MRWKLMPICPFGSLNIRALWHCLCHMSSQVPMHVSKDDRILYWNERNSGRSGHCYGWSPWGDEEMGKRGMRTVRRALAKWKELVWKTCSLRLWKRKLVYGKGDNGMYLDFKKQETHRWKYMCICFRSKRCSRILAFCVVAFSYMAVSMVVLVLCITGWWRW